MNCRPRPDAGSSPRITSRPEETAARHAARHAAALDIARRDAEVYRERKRKERLNAIVELRPAELLAKIKKWAKDNDCPIEEAITRLVGLGLDASKAEKAAARKAKRLADR
jgi:hypothetical protein